VSLTYTLGFLALLWVSILLHEYGHVFAARRCGIKADDILLWPLGGLALIGGEAEDPREEVFIAAAGPLVSVACALVALLVAVAIGAKVEWGLFDPFHAWFPRGWSDLPVELACNVWRANVAMVLFNVFVPAFP